MGKGELLSFEAVQKERGIAEKLSISPSRTPIRSSFEREAKSPNHIKGWRSRIPQRDPFGKVRDDALFGQPRN